VAKTDNMIGFILYGKVKIFNKDYREIIERGDTFGEHLLFNFDISLKVRCLEPTCVFWLPVKYYAILREESIINGLKSEFNHL
jgi:CRP-like cAMP-binding protein